MKKSSLILIAASGFILAACNSGSGSSGGGDNPNPTTGLTASFTDGNNFNATTDTPTITKVLTLSNSGESNASQINFTLPSNGYFAVATDDTGTSPCSISNQSITNTLSQNQKCTLKVTYNNATTTPSSSANVTFNYLYGTESKTQTTNVSYMTTYIPSNKVKYVAVGDSNNTWYSSNGTSWTNVKVTASTNYVQLNSVAYGSSGFVTVSDNSTSYVSTDGKTWSGPYVISDKLNRLSSVIYANNQYIAVGSAATSPSNASAFTSPDGKTWTQHTVNGATTSGSLRSITYANGSYVAVGYNSSYSKPLICQSPDASNWSCQSMDLSTPNYGGFYTVSYGNGIFVVSGNNGLTFYSVDNGNTWIQQNISSSVKINSIAYGNNKFIAVGQSFTYNSTNALSWATKQIISSSNPSLSTITFDGTKFWTSGDSATFTSTDGENWTSQTIAPGNYIYDMVYTSSL